MFNSVSTIPTIMRLLGKMTHRMSDVSDLDTNLTSSGLDYVWDVVEDKRNVSSTPGLMCYLDVEENR